MGETLAVTAPAKERKHTLERVLSKVDATVCVVAVILIFSALDFYSHPHNGVADPERRKFLFEHLGQIAKHLGNFAFTAAYSITAVFAKHFGEFLASSKFSKNLVQGAYIVGASGILIINGLVEVYANNPEMTGDISMALAAFGLATLSTEMAVRKFKKARKQALAQNRAAAQ